MYLVPVLLVCTTGMREIFITCAGDCNCAIFERLYFTFFCIYMMVVRFYWLYYDVLLF